MINNVIFKKTKKLDDFLTKIRVTVVKYFKTLILFVFILL